MIKKQYLVPIKGHVQDRTPKSQNIHFSSASGSGSNPWAQRQSEQDVMRASTSMSRRPPRQKNRKWRTLPVPARNNAAQEVNFSPQRGVNQGVGALQLSQPAAWGRHEAPTTPGVRHGTIGEVRLQSSTGASREPPEGNVGMRKEKKGWEFMPSLDVDHLVVLNRLKVHVQPSQTEGLEEVFLFGCCFFFLWQCGHKMACFCFSFLHFCGINTFTLRGGKKSIDLAI